MDRSDKRAGAFCEAVEAGDAARIRTLFQDHPELAEVIDANWFSFGATALGMLAKREHKDAIEALLDAGADPNAKSDWEAGPYHVLDTIVDRPPPVDVELADLLISRGARLDIHAASGLGRLDTLAELLDQDATRVSEPGPDGATPLHLAMNVEVAAFLLDRGAEIDKRCVDHNSTAAQWAAQGRLDVMRFLIDRGARPDLYMAAVLDDVELADRLLAEDPDALSVRVRPGKSHEHVGFGDKYVWALNFAETPLEAARRADSQAVYRYLLDRSPASVRMLHAARRGDVEVLRGILDGDPDLLPSLSEEQVAPMLLGETAAVAALLEAGADPNARDDDTRATPCHHSAWRGDRDRIEVLLAHGADLSIRDERYTSSPLGWASEAGHEDLVQWLADQAPLDIVDAAWLGRLDRIEEILDRDPEAIHGFGNGEASPLRTAVWCGHEDIVRLLLARGADRNAENPHTGMNALDVAIEREHDTIADILRR